MKNFLIPIMLLIVSGISNAQERTFETVDSLVNSYAQELLNNTNADNVLIYKTGCIGCEIIGDCSCEIGSIKSYIFWKECDKSYVKEIGCCEISDKIEKDLDAVWRELDSKEEAIFDSKFETDKENAHYDFYEVKLIKKESAQEIKMSDFYFTADNKYQEQNSIQAARKFQKLIESILGE